MSQKIPEPKLSKTEAAFLKKWALILFVESQECSEAAQRAVDTGYGNDYLKDDLDNHAAGLFSAACILADADADYVRKAEEERIRKIKGTWYVRGSGGEADAVAGSRGPKDL